ncbi:MAG: ParB/RepB/Spo0J family partition protein [Burkholderiales bacterium]|jgi:ParB family chromosome partitioning protein|nr:ParB/RepB/Spo0J family partition protein [Burkholderiales bacterium]MCH1425307.1 ParB/RepB/Spo0J family partition protein [Burkholderiales bacterium]
MVRAKGLGKGLDALFSSGKTVNDDEPGPMSTLPVEGLQPGKFQPRTKMDDDAIAELSESIRSQGVIQPLIVRPISSGKHEIIAGERRWRAAQKAGLKLVPVVIKKSDDKSAMAMALIENIQREDLTSIDEAIGIKRLIEEFEMTHEAVARILGKSRSTVTNLQRLLSLAEPVQQMLRDQKIEMGHARSLLGLEASRQVDLAKRIVALDLTVREVESLVGAVSTRLGGKGKSQQGRQNIDRDTVNLQEQLAQHLGLPVRITQSKRGSGKIALSFSDLDELEVLLAKLRA